MNKQILSPFDCDLCAMVEDLTGNPIDVKPQSDYFVLSWEQCPCDRTNPEGQKAEAIKQAVNGRLGTRAIARRVKCAERWRQRKPSARNPVKRNTGNRRRSTFQRRCKQWRNFSAKCSPEQRLKYTGSKCHGATHGINAEEKTNEKTARNGYDDTVSNDRGEQPKNGIAIMRANLFQSGCL